MRVLVTGILGYIGAHLGPLLEARGHQIIGLDTGFYADTHLGPPTGILPCLISKDTREVTAVDLRGFDACVHLAELSNDPLGELSPRITYDINHTGSVRLARLCREAGVSRFVYASSCSVYGTGSDQTKDEQSPPDPQTAYAECKVLVERGVTALADDDFSPTFLRNATAYGPSPSMRFDLVLNNLAGLAWTTRRVAMTSDGTPWRPLVHVQDICQAIALTLEAPRASVHNEVFNVGDNEANYRVRDIAELVAGAFEGCRITFGTAGADNRSYRVSFDKIRAHLPEFRCRWTAGTGAEELRAFFEGIRLTGELFEFRAFTRIKQIRHLVQTGQLDERFFWTQRPVGMELTGRAANPS